MKRTYTGTRVACYIGYFVQAIINCLSPVLFIVYQTELSLSYSQLSMLVLVNFLTQLCVDLLSARYVDRIGYRRAITLAHILAALAPWPIVSLLGCGLCGLSVGLMWPGVFSLTSAQYAAGGTTMFAVLAVFGDLGCAFGPWLTGEVSAAAEAANSPLSGLSCGLLAALVFPILMLVLLRVQKRSEKGASD